MLDVSKELLIQCLKKDRRAQNMLYEKCFGILMSIGLRYEKNEEDARFMVNIGFMKIITKLNKYHFDVEFEYWIRRIMINTMIDEYRKNKRRNEVIKYNDLENTYMRNQVSVLNKADDQFNAEELQLMIRLLPTDTQKVFNLFAIDGYSHKEISEMMKIPVGTSKWHVSKAREILVKMIERKNEHIKENVS